MSLVVVVVVVLVAAAAWLRRHCAWFSRRGLRHGRAWPLLGDMATVLFRRRHITDVLMHAYMSHPGERLVGRYEFLNRHLLVKDPELVKRITVTDCDYFIDRRSLIDPKIEPVFCRSVILLKGEEWKEMRSALGPTFTGAKIRHMVPFMLHVGDQMLSSLTNKIEHAKDGYIDLQAIDVAQRYACDVIATCAFGIQVDSQHEDNEFYVMSKLLNNMSYTAHLGYRFLPRITAWLGINLLPPKATRYFYQLVLQVMRQREELGMHRPDMIHLMMELQKGKLLDEKKTTGADDQDGFAASKEADVGVGKVPTKTVWDESDMVSQAVTFLLAGYETVSTGVSFLLLELARNPAAQARLARELRADERFQLASVLALPYLDMCVSEALRLWPPVLLVDRQCVRDYNVGKPSDTATQDVIIRKGELVQMPIWAYHRNPEYFPEPDKFDPERFSEENKHRISRFVYMPFGAGPRNCMGGRFAVTEMKVMVWQLLRRVRVSLCARSCVPLRFAARDGFRMTAPGGNWLRFSLRE